MVVIRQGSFTAPKDQKVKRDTPPQRSRATFLKLALPLLLLITGLSWMILSVIQNLNDQEPTPNSTPTPHTASDDSPRRSKSHHMQNNSLELPPFAGCVDPANLSSEDTVEETERTVPETIRFLNEGRSPERTLPVYDEAELEIAGPCPNENVWDLVIDDENGRAQHIYVSLPDPRSDRGFPYGLGVSSRYPLSDENGQLLGWIDSGYMAVDTRYFTTLDGEERTIPMTRSEDLNGASIIEFSASPDDPEFAGNLVYGGENGPEIQDASGNVLARQGLNFAGVSFTTNPDACNRVLDPNNENYYDDYDAIWESEGTIIIQRDAEDFRGRLLNFLP